jgi:hypothetical protein
VHEHAAKIMVDEGVIDPDSAIEMAALRLENSEHIPDVTPDEIGHTFGHGAINAIQPETAHEHGRSPSEGTHDLAKSRLPTQLR